jgi:cytochrome b561
LPAWQHRAAGLSHLALYALLVIMPVAGYIRVKAGGFPIETLDWLGLPSLVARSDAVAEAAKTLHYLGGLAIAALIGMHIAAAAFHGIVRRDGVFSRMWPPFSRGTH